MMLAIPSRLHTQFREYLRDKTVPPNTQAAYTKWLRYYLDFCQKYHCPHEDRASLPHFLQKLQDKKQTQARNPKWLGGAIGMVGVLHTWDRSMGDHLHVHYLVPAGGVDPTTGEWKPAHPKFLVPGSALRTVFRATFRDALKTAAPDLFAQVPPTTWNQNWGVHCQPVGDGRTALKYLAP